MTIRLRAAICGITMLICASQFAFAGEAVDVGGSRAALIKPASPRWSVILMAGGDGRINVASDGEILSLMGNQLIRTRARYVSAGLAVLVVDAGVNLSAAVDYMAKIKRPVVVIGTSRGTQRAAEGIAAGAKPDALVLTSGFLSPESGGQASVMSILGSPDRLPRTLVIHHREDGCKFTQPAGVDPFIKWAGGRARVQWLSGGPEVGDPCQAAGHHGFAGLDGQVVSLAASFR
ncbi:MAG: alpha/beta hydrolase [Afipia sp.]|nr:alpha/beta hydrolase [Afipia sp.]